MSPPQKPKVIPPPRALPVLGPLVVVDGECAYLPHADGTPRPSRTAFALPGRLTAAEYQQAMSLGMRRSGTLVYRPLCAGCRKCQPFRVDVERFALSRSQKRVAKRCDGMFDVEVTRPRCDPEHLKLYARYQADQHNKDGQSADEESYLRFLVDTLTDTWELAWRDRAGKLVAVGVIDVVDDGLSTVYFYWDPALRDLSLGVYSALWEIDLARRWKKQYYYLGYLVPGADTMEYKAQFAGGEVWDGAHWQPVASRDLTDTSFIAALSRAEQGALVTDQRAFALEPEDPT